MKKGPPDQFCITKEWLEKVYIEDKISIQDIARQLGCNDWTIYNRIRRFDLFLHGISKASDRHPELLDRNWLINQQKLGKTKAMIAKELSISYQTLQLAFKTLNIPNNDRKLAGSLRRGKTRWDKNPNWHSGRTRSGKGYIMIRLRPDDFFYRMTNKVGQVLEHRLITAKHLSRCLLPWEIVHHKNGVKDDNRLENLQLLPHSKFHIVDSKIKRRMNFLEQRVTQLEAEVVLLRAELETERTLKSRNDRSQEGQNYP